MDVTCGGERFKSVLTRLFHLSFPSQSQKLKLVSNQGDFFLKSHDGTFESRGERVNEGGRAGKEESERCVWSGAGQQVETEVDQPHLIWLRLCSPFIALQKQRERFSVGWIC